MQAFTSAVFLNTRNFLYKLLIFILRLPVLTINNTLMSHDHNKAYNYTHKWLNQMIAEFNFLHDKVALYFFIS